MPNLRKSNMHLKLYCAKVNTWKNTIYFRRGTKNNLFLSSCLTISGSVLIWVSYGWVLFTSTQKKPFSLTLGFFKSFMVYLFKIPESSQHLVPPIFVLIMTGIVITAIFFILYVLFLLLPPLLIRQELLEKLLSTNDSSEQ